MKTNWKILNLTRNLDTGNVVKVFWQAKATNNKSVEGSLDFNRNVFDSNFIPYLELKEDDVLGWVWSKLDKKDIENSLKNTSEKQVFKEGKPWEIINDH